MGFDKVFSRQLEAVGEKGDVLFALTTSGKSANILNALKVSKKKKLKLFYYLQSLQKKQKLCDVNIRPNANRVDRIQELHIAIGHLICEMVEQELT